MLWINIPNMHMFWIIQEDSTLFSNANVCWFAQKKKANPISVSWQINMRERWGTSNNSQLLQIDQCQIHYQILSKSVLWRSRMLPDAKIPSNSQWNVSLSELYWGRLFWETSRTTLPNIKQWSFQIYQRPQVSVAVIVVVFHWCWGKRHVFITRWKRLRAGTPWWRPDTCSRETTSKQAPVNTP